MKQKDLKLLLDARLVASVRVVPIPLASGWCVDVLIKELLSTGSRTATLECDRSSVRRRRVRRFATIDSAAKFLHRLGIDAFVVDVTDSISFAAAESPDEKLHEDTASLALPGGGSEQP